MDAPCSGDGGGTRGRTPAASHLETEARRSSTAVSNRRIQRLALRSAGINGALIGGDVQAAVVGASQGRKEADCGQVASRRRRRRRRRPGGGGGGLTLEEAGAEARRRRRGWPHAGGGGGGGTRGGLSAATCRWNRAGRGGWAVRLKMRVGFFFFSFLLYRFGGFLVHEHPHQAYIGAL
jgi:hypothetical protein